MTVELIPCNCYHSQADHTQLELGFYTWCRYSEYGQCPCDCYTAMDNLAYLEWMSRELN